MRVIKIIDNLVDPLRCFITDADEILIQKSLYSERFLIIISKLNESLECISQNVVLKILYTGIYPAIIQCKTNESC